MPASLCKRPFHSFFLPLFLLPTHLAMANSNILSQPVGIIGTGVAGLINAHVLLQDGFTDVTLISRDKSVGGTWARERVYPGLHINKYVCTLSLAPSTILTPRTPCQCSWRVQVFPSRNATTRTLGRDRRTADWDCHARLHGNLFQDVSQGES